MQRRVAISELLNVKGSFPFIQFQLSGLGIEADLAFQSIDGVRSRSNLSLSDKLVCLMLFRMIWADDLMPG